jgi:predicted RNA binding protein YcfA (HicA-like mRNA interferase family)
MGQRRYPLLTCSEVQAILQRLGFKKDRHVGSHEQYVCEASEKYPRSIVTVDTSYPEFGDIKLMKSMIRQSNRTREEFYGATKKTAQKASVKFVKLSTSTDPE